MNKYLFLLFVLVCGCGAPPTNQEIMIDRYFQSFKNDCKAVYGECNLPVTDIKVVYAKEVNEKNGMCWTIDGSNAKFLAINKSIVENEQQVHIYKQLFNCFLKFDANANLKFVDFANNLNLDVTQLGETDD